MFPFSYNPYTNECYIHNNVNNAVPNQDLYCLSPFGFQKTQPVVKTAVTEFQNLVWKFNPGEHQSDELVIGKRVSPEQISLFLTAFLEHQQRLKLRKHQERQQKQLFDPIFGQLTNALFNQSYYSDEFSSLDYKQAGEALSKKVFKNYKFSMTDNDNELVVIDNYGQVVKIFELEDSYENLAVKSMFMEDNVAVITLKLYKKQQNFKNSLNQSAINISKKNKSSCNNKIQKSSPAYSYPVSVNEVVRALEELINQKDSGKTKATLKNKKENTFLEKQISEEKINAEAEHKRVQEQKEANDKAELKKKEEEEAAMLVKKEKLAKAKHEYALKQKKIKEKQERMAHQVEKLKQKELSLQQLYAQELAELVQEVENKEISNNKIKTHISKEEQHSNSDSSDDVDMNEESSCSTDDDEKILHKREPILKKSTSIVVEDIEDESDKDYRKSLINSPTSNAVLEGI
ncbi:hypothetical protein QEN19_000805 [Hanseniaspora menglaensis]